MAGETVVFNVPWQIKILSSPTQLQKPAYWGKQTVMCMQPAGCIKTIMSPPRHKVSTAVDVFVCVRLQWLTHMPLTQSERSEVEHRRPVAAGVQDVVLILKHLAAAFRHRPDTIAFIIFNYITFNHESIIFSSQSTLFRRQTLRYEEEIPPNSCVCCYMLSLSLMGL